jgi:hypothetical protein
MKSARLRVREAHGSFRSVTRRRAMLACAALFGAGCQWIAGLDDPLVDPSDAGGSDVLQADSNSDGGNPDVAVLARVYRDRVLSDKPLVYLRFSETSGVLCNDETDAQSPGVLSGASRGAQGALTGDPDPAAHFDSNGGILSLGDRFDFRVEPYTYELWVRPSADALSQAMLFHKQETDHRGVLAFFSFGDAGPVKLGFERWDDNTILVAFAHSLQTELTAGRYNHIVVVGSPTGPRLFLDGVQLGDSYAAPDAQIAPTTSASLEFGGGWTGDIDEVAIYGYALDPTTVLLHYTLGTLGR